MADDIGQEITEWLLDNFWVKEYEEIRELSKCSPDVDDIKITVHANKIK
ncbi:MAG: hypothetical protein Unbinned8138contig1000_2 [Prokaryotic dsDNA virus sp.]|nr:MAG: hypothetical protein Unbinned8138contig1000_2 [Prokaryotic dsDNA virus sp.]